MNAGAESASWRRDARQRALPVALGACAAALALAGGPRVSGVLLLPALFMFAEFTGGWIAVAIASMLLGAVTLVVTSPVYPLMFTAAAALLGARSVRAGWPSSVAVLWLAAGALAASWLGAQSPGGAARGAWSPDSVARALLDACFNVASITVFLVARPPRKWWIPPLRRWRHEDVLLLASAAAFIPFAITLRVAPSLDAVPGWSSVAVILAVLAGVTAAGLASGRIIRGLRTLLERGRVRAVRRRSSRLSRETASLYLAAREVSDDLHRRTAVQELQLESARLRAGRLQQQVESHERERRRMELALHQAAGAGDAVERRWRAFLDALPEALFIAEPSGRIEYVNEGVRQLLGYDPRALEATHITALIPAAQSDHDVLGLAAAVTPGEGGAATSERPLRIRDAQGALRQLAARVQVFQTSQGARLGIRLREASAPSQRARDQFVATLSHEIRTPLHGLMATLDMLRSEALSVAGAKRLGIARTSAKTLVRIANDILDLSRISAGGMAIERRAMSIERLVSDVVDEARAREEALRLDVFAVIGDSVPSAVLGDPLRIKQVLRNLVSNALKFTPAGRVTVSASWANDHCVIDVGDTGPGIPAGRRESIFEAFVQADGAKSRRQGGAGLGLAIGRQLSEAMGGSLSLLQSGPRGSTFRLVLPLPATDEAPPDEQSQRNLQAVKGRILVAEDDDASRYVAQALLESLGCPARIVADGSEALALLRSGEFDLALLDCEMPGLDGYEVTARFRKSGVRHIPIIAMTASTMSADRQRCFDAGMDDMLAKPFGKSALNDILVKWLGPPASAQSQAPLAKELATRPELDTEVFDELRQSLHWQLPPMRKIYASISESARKALGALGDGAPGDVELAMRRLHSLQGGAALVGARQLEYLATRLSLALKNQRAAELAEGMPLLPDALVRFEKVVDSRLESLSAR
jgi:PAS domain S-box-containing protein